MKENITRCLPEGRLDVPTIVRTWRPLGQNGQNDRTDMHFNEIRFPVEGSGANP
jgi:hypothetical protein